MKSPKDFWYQMALMNLADIGPEKAFQIIEDLKAQKAFPKKEYYSRLKKEIREAFISKDYSDSIDLIQELDKKIKQVKVYYR